MSVLKHRKAYLSTGIAVATLLAAALPLVAEVPLINVQEITVSPSSNGQTVVEVTVDKPLLDGSYHSFHISGESPRKVLCLRNVERPFRQSQLPVAGQRLLRVRTGYHPELIPPELHIVLDLASDQFSDIWISHQETKIRVELGTPQVVTEAPDSGTEATRVEPAEAETTPVPIQVSDRNHAAQITGIEAVEQENGSTVVTITADRPFAPFSIRELFFAGNPPHYALSLTGVVLMETVPAQQEVANDTLRRITVLTYPTRQPSEVQLDLTLASADVGVAEVVQDGARLVVHLDVAAQ
jgi:hypothetical protein